MLMINVRFLIEEPVFRVKALGVYDCYYEVVV